MNDKHLFWATAAFAVIAATSVTLLMAAPPILKGYLIAEITVTDPNVFKQYATASTTVMTQFGGKYLIRGGQAIAEEGSPPAERTVIIEFDSLAAARAFYDSAAYKAVIPMRLKSAKSRVFLVEGSPLL